MSCFLCKLCEALILLKALPDDSSMLTFLSVAYVVTLYWQQQTTHVVGLTAAHTLLCRQWCQAVVHLFVVHMISRPGVS